MDLGATTDPEMPELYKDTSDDDEAPPRPPGNSSDGNGVAAAGLGTLAPPYPNADSPPPETSQPQGRLSSANGIAPPADPSPPQGGLSSANGLAFGTDTRGLGLETFDGRCSVRMRKGATRPRSIPPEVWQRYSKKRKLEAIA